jgi:hypothetical protein
MTVCLMELPSDQLQYLLRNQRCTVCDFQQANFTNKLTRCTLITKLFCECQQERVKGLQMCVECVPTHRILYIRIWYTFRNSSTRHCVGSLVQRGNSVFNEAYPLTSLDLLSVLDGQDPGSAICLWWIRSKISLSVLTYLTVCLYSQ